MPSPIASTDDALPVSSLEDNNNRIRETTQETSPRTSQHPPDTIHVVGTPTSPEDIARTRRNPPTGQRVVAVFGIPVDDKETARRVFIVVQVSIVIALVQIGSTVFMLLVPSPSDKALLESRRDDGDVSASEQQEGFIIALNLCVALVLPLCGWLGAKERNHDMVGMFAMCAGVGACIEIFTLVISISALVVIQDDHDCSDVQEYVAVEDQTECNSFRKNETLHLQGSVALQCASVVLNLIALRWGTLLWHKMISQPRQLRGLPGPAHTGVYGALRGFVVNAGGRVRGAANGWSGGARGGAVRGEAVVDPNNGTAIVGHVVGRAGARRSRIPPGGIDELGVAMGEAPRNDEDV